MSPRGDALRAAGRLGLCLVCICIGWATPIPVLAATEIDRDAYWVESAVCTVVIKAPTDPAQALGALVTAAASCTGNLMAQVVPGGVHSMLQRGFRITTAHHQIVTLPARADTEMTMLVTGLFALERPAVKSPTIPK